MFWKFTAIIDVDEQVRGCGCALEEEPIGRGLAYTSLQYYKVFFATCMANQEAHSAFALRTIILHSLAQISSPRLLPWIQGAFIGHTV